MCVIIVKKAGEKLPSRNLLKKAAIANPDGCGFASSSGAYFRHVDFDVFYAIFKAKARVEDDIVIHFRWATHGSVKSSNCHPFMGRDANGEPIWFAHNGILPIPSRNDKTDSEIAFRDYILPALQTEGGMTEEFKDELEDFAGGSKFAFVSKDGLTLIGDFVDFAGLKLSNTRFLGMSYYYGSRTAKYVGKYAGVGL